MPNQLNKIYPTVSNSFTVLNNQSENLEMSRQQTYIPSRESSKIDLSDIKRPISSTLKATGSIYMKQDKYPRFPQQKSILNFQNTEQKISGNGEDNAAYDDDSNGREFFPD